MERGIQNKNETAKREVLDVRIELTTSGFLSVLVVDYETKSKIRVLPARRGGPDELRSTD